MNRINDEKRIVDLEYKLICDFISLRKELGLTQKELGEASNTIREIIAVIETRKKHPQINTLIKILEPFGYTISITKIQEEENDRR